MSCKIEVHSALCILDRSEMFVSFNPLWSLWHDNSVPFYGITTSHHNKAV